ncbi:hypothetical protein DL96DRAFT_1631420, partial [Flagelloscypha sp. PMI_526]
MVVFKNAPIDLARLIVETAALSDWSLCTARALSCVSREVQLWSDQFLFQNIVIQEEGAAPGAMLRFIDDFISEDPSPRIGRARAYIKTFSTKQEEDYDGRIPKFISLCSALESLCIWSLEHDSSYFSTNIPSLRKMSLASFDYPLSFKMPLFQAVTHLELAGVMTAGWPLIWNADLSSMPSLTHL